MAENQSTPATTQCWLSDREAAPKALPVTQHPELPQNPLQKHSVEITPIDLCPACGREKSEEVKKTSAVSPERRLEIVQVALKAAEADLFHAAEELACLFNQDFGGWQCEPGDHPWRKVKEAMEQVASTLAVSKQHQVGYAQVKRMVEYSKEHKG